MATSTTTAITSHTNTLTSNTKNPPLKLPKIKPKTSKYRETTISTTAQPTNKLDPPIIVTPHNSSWCCHPTRDQPEPNQPDVIKPMEFTPTSSSSSSSNTLMLSSNGNHSPFPSSFTKFNSALTAGLLNPLSPPPDNSKTRSSPTLFEMMANEPEMPHLMQQSQQPRSNIVLKPSLSLSQQTLSVQDKQSMVLQRVSEMLGNRSPGSQFNDQTTGDVKLTLSSKDGISVSMSVHRQILVAHSRFFAVKLSDRWASRQQQQQQQQGRVAAGPYAVEIADCDDVEVYIETLRLMYCRDLRRKLMREDVTKVLGILKVSAAIGFDAGVLSCLEYLEAAPWAEDEEEKVASLLSELHLEGVGAGEVLKRVSVEVTNGAEEGGDNEEVVLKLLNVVLEGKDEKARREMKGLLLKMLRENSLQNDLRKESLYLACDECLQLLRSHFLKAAEANLDEVGQIARQADNLHWILDILIDRQIAEDFLKTWASESEMSQAHSKVPAVRRFEVSRVTARLFVGIGKGQLLASKEVRCLLLQTWLVPFYDDFAWMKRASKGLDRHLIEDGLSNTILTLPLAWQQDILLTWFNRFLNSGEDCPNIQRGFEVWWRRAFWRRNGEPEKTRPMRITTSTIENS